MRAFGATVFAQGLPSGATAWEYATYRQQKIVTGSRYLWTAPGVGNGIGGEIEEFYPSLAAHYGIDYEAVRDTLSPRGFPTSPNVAHAMNLVGIVGWELVAYFPEDANGVVEAIFKRPRP